MGIVWHVETWGFRRIRRSITCICTSVFWRQNQPVLSKRKERILCNSNSIPGKENVIIFLVAKEAIHVDLEIYRRISRLNRCK